MGGYYSNWLIPDICLLQDYQRDEEKIGQKPNQVISSILIYLIYVISDMDMLFNMESDNKKEVKKCHFCHLFLKLSR